MRIGKSARVWIFGRDSIALSDAKQAAGAHVSGRLKNIAVIDGLHDFVGRHVVGSQAIRIHRDDNGALVAAEGWRRGNAGKRGEGRPHAVKSQVLDLAEGASLAGKHDIADRHGAGVETDHERRNCSGRHESAGAIHVGYRLREGLAHVRAGIEGQFQNAVALNGLVLDTLNPVDVKEVIFVVVDEIAFHLRRTHPPIGLRDVDHREIQVREDVDAHPRDGQYGAERYTDHHHQGGNRASQCRANQPHGNSFTAPSGESPLTGIEPRNTLKNGCKSPCAEATLKRLCHTFSRATASSISA